MRDSSGSQRARWRLPCSLACSLVVPGHPCLRRILAKVRHRKSSRNIRRFPRHSPRNKIGRDKIQTLPRKRPNQRMDPVL